MKYYIKYIIQPNICIVKLRFSISIKYLQNQVIIFKTKLENWLASRARRYTRRAFACWGISPIPIEHTINCVATLPLGAEKS